ncbi:MAG: phosphodiester glycosidase family protein, partial [Nitrospinota bacterium]
PAFAAAEDECLFSGRVAGEGGWRPLGAGLEVRDLVVRFDDASVARMSGVRVETGRYRARLHWNSKSAPAGESAADVARQTGAAVVTNAGYFDENGRPLGFFLTEGKTYNRRVLFRGRNEALHLGAVFSVLGGTEKMSIAGREEFDPEGKTEAFQAGPYLVREGRPVPGIERYREFWRLARRTVLGFEGDGRLIVLVSEPEGRGLSWCELQLVLSRPAASGGLGIAEAMNLDGGSSSQLLVQAAGQRLEMAGRPVPAFLILIGRQEGR